MLLYSVVYSFGGIPLLYMGDELALRNDAGYLADPERGAGQPVDAPAADGLGGGRAGATDPATLEGRVFGWLQRLGEVRRALPALRGGGECTVLDVGNDAVLACRRRHPRSGAFVGPGQPQPGTADRGRRHGDRVRHLRPRADQRRDPRSCGPTACCCPASASPGTPSPEHRVLRDWCVPGRGLTVSTRLITGRPRVPGQRRRRPGAPPCTGARVEVLRRQSSTDPTARRRLRTPARARRGATFGVEEEFHLVDPVSYRLTRSPALAEAVLRGEAGRHLHAEITTTQLESATGICTSLVGAARRAGHHPRGGGRRRGPRRACASSPPRPTRSTAGTQQDITPAPRYQAMVERWAGLALQQDICGCHVHVGVPDLETAVAVMDRARPYLPVLLAMTGSSPFHDGVDTGHDSYRTMWWSRWPMTGPPEYLGSAERFQEVVARAGRLRRDRRRLAPLLGPAALLATCRRWSSGSPTCAPRWTTWCCTPPWRGRWSARSPPGPSGASRARSRARSCCGRPGGGRPGTASTVSCSTSCRRELVPARMAVRRLLAELQEDLRDHDEWADRRRARGAAVRAGHVGVAAAADLAAHGRLAAGGRRDRPRGDGAGELRGHAGPAAQADSRPVTSSPSGDVLGATGLGRLEVRAEVFQREPAVDLLLGGHPLGAAAARGS